MSAATEDLGIGTAVIVPKGIDIHYVERPWDDRSRPSRREQIVTLVNADNDMYAWTDARGQWRWVTEEDAHRLTTVSGHRPLWKRERTGGGNLAHNRPGWGNGWVCECGESCRPIYPKREAQSRYRDHLAAVKARKED